MWRRPDSFTLLAALALGAGILLAGCSRSGDNDTQNKSENVQGSASKVSDANIVATLASADSFEVAVGKLALSRSADKRVKNFARMLINDHTQHEGDMKDLADRAGITPAPPSGDTSARHMENVMGRLRSAGKGHNFDKTFVAAAIADHQQDISEVKDMQSSASNDALKQELNQTLPKLQEHLNHAQELQGELGSGNAKSRPSKSR